MSSIQIALAATKRIVHAVLRATDERALLEEACEIIVDVGYRFCWVGEVVHDEQKSVRPLAWAGFEAGYLSSARISWADTERGRGPTGVSIRSGRPMVIPDVQKAVEFSPWLAEAGKRGYRSCCGMPLMTEAMPFGNLNIYSEQFDAFGEQPMELLVNLAEVLSFGLMNLRHRQRTQETLRQTEEKYREIFDHAVVGMFQSTPDGRYLKVNQALARMSGYGSPQEMIEAISDMGRQEYVDPARREELMRLLAEHGVVRDFECEYFRKDGSRAWSRINARAVRDAQGHTLYFEGTDQDITDAKRLESQFEQAQKMEAVGRLAGGVAHDFNNLLSVILGYADLSSSLLDPAHPAFEKIAQMRLAAERGAALTRQLLAFSRRQVVHPRVLDLNKIIGGSTDMLKRLVGEDVEISFQPADQLWMIRVDPGQIEQILMNLSVNARDAMPRGGRIRIETGNIQADELFVSRHPQLRPGSYVMLVFSDSGAGIAAENIPLIFEPFFTTKEVGKGTGLGLATVYGIVKQDNGGIWVSSAPGQGTTFCICFPRADGSEIAALRAAPAEAPRGSDTILLVEDESSLRELAASVLGGAGYKVLKAENGPEALVLVQSFRGKIDLLLTDAIMPGMSGVELCSQILKLRPEIRLLCMSGYTGDQLSPYGQFESENTFLQKPFSNSALLRKVRAALDA